MMIRSSSPSFVQALWDGIEQSDYRSEFTTSLRFCIPLKKLKTFLQQKLNSSEENVLTELRKAKADGLVVSKFGYDRSRRGNGKELELYALPNREEFSDRRQHDWYCFNCHEGEGSGCVVYCTTCPRIYHADCLKVKVKIENARFACPACKKLVCRPSRERLNVSLEDLNNFIKYSCSRFHEWDIPKLNHADGRSWAQASGRDEAKNAWRYDRLIYSSIDLSGILRKSKEFRYTCLEEYETDCNMLVHNVAVYFGSNTVNRTSITGKFHEGFIHDIKEIQVCPDCFRHSNELQPEWFALPCSNPHEVVWARFKGYPYWPAKVIKKDLDAGTYDVRFFGDEHYRAEITSRNIEPITTSPSKLRIGRRTAGWRRAYEELQKFQQFALALQTRLRNSNGPGSTLADVSGAADREELKEVCIPRAIDEGNTDATRTTGISDRDLEAIANQAGSPKRKKTVRFATECSPTAEQLPNGEHNEDFINLVTDKEDGATTMTRLPIGCTETTEEVKNSKDVIVSGATNEGEATVNGYHDGSPPTTKQQAGCSAEQRNDVDGAGQGLGPPLWDVSSPIDLEELSGEYKVIVLDEEESHATVTDIISTQCEPHEKSSRFDAAEELTNDERGENVFNVEETRDEEDPLALSSAHDISPSAEEKTELCTEDSKKTEVPGQCSLLWSSVVKDTRVAQLLEDLQCCESIGVTDIAIICMILDKRKGCECPGCQDQKLRVCSCLHTK